VLCIALLTLIGFLPSLAVAQILQNHPEICGKPGGYVRLSDGITATSTGLEFTLQIRTGASTVDVKLGSVDEVQEVCPLANNRVAIFSRAGDTQTYSIHVVDATNGRVIESFDVRSPATSPDQRWLAARQFFPAQMQSPMEIYGVYDLVRTPSVTGGRGTEFFKRSNIVYPPPDDPDDATHEHAGDFASLVGGQVADLY
jgi:hypothetical protein